MPPSRAPCGVAACPSLSVAKNPLPRRVLCGVAACPSLSVAKNPLPSPCPLRRGGLPLAFTLLSQVKAKMATRFAVCCGNGERCPHVGQRSKQHGLRWGACTRCEWESNEEATSKWLAASNAYVCLLCWLEARRVRDVCLCRGTSMMLARTRRQQLMLAHREGRAVPAGIPDGLRNMWNDTEALDNFPDVPPPGPGAAPLADVPPPPPDVPPPVVEAPARPVVDLMNLLEPVPFEPPAAQPPADVLNLLQPVFTAGASRTSTALPRWRSGCILS